MQQKYMQIIREKFVDKELAEVPLMESEVKGLGGLRLLGALLWDQTKDGKHGRAS